MNQRLRLDHRVAMTRINHAATPIRGIRIVALAGVCLAFAAAVCAEDRPADPGGSLAATPGDELAVRAAAEAEREGTMLPHSFDVARSADRPAAGEPELLDPNLDPEQVAAVLSDLMSTDNQTKGGPTANGFELHRKWGVNGLRDDRFAGANDGRYRARAAARLPSGEVVVVGDIRLNAGGATELGIVKYNSRGQRVTWTNASAQHGHFSNGYLRFPGTGTWGGSTVFSVHDVRVRDSDIYALVTKLLPDNRFIPGIVRFRADGSFGGSWESAPDGGLIRDAVAMDISGNQMIVLGRRTLLTTTADGGFWTSRWTIGDDGNLSLGVTSTFLAGLRRVPADITFARSGLLVFPPPTSPAYYVAYTANLGDSATSDHDPCFARINASNVPDPNFGTNGLRCFAFDDGGDRVDQAVSVHNRGFTTFVGGQLVGNEALYLVASVERTVTDGIGIVNLTNGVPDTNFGPLGRRVYGGCAVNNFGGGSGCGVLYVDGNNRSHTPAAVYTSASPDGVFIAGWSTSPSATRPILMDVSATDGSLRTVQSFGNVPGSLFTGLVPRGDAGEFTTVGWGADTEGSTTPYFLSAHLVKRNDLIFYDGLQTP